MLKAIKAYSPSEKIVVRDSLDDEISDDVEDDVFIRDGKSARVRSTIIRSSTEFNRIMTTEQITWENIYNFH